MLERVVPQKRCALWTMVVIVWLFITTTLFLSAPPESPLGRPPTQETKRADLVVPRAVSAQRTPARKQYHVVPLQSSARNGPKFNQKANTQLQMLAIGSRKMTLLAATLKNIMTSHERPRDDYFGFNVTRSDSIPVNRAVSDHRPRQCQEAAFNESSFSTISVITPIHNEALSTLVRHVFAILLRTPPQLLIDIILVDDNSTLTFLGPDLENYFRILDSSRIRMLRNKKREGLVVSRLRGADVARGDVLVFLDAHMEVGPGWSEPLLERLNTQSNIVVQPDVPSIDSETLAFTTGDDVSFRGGFGWDMRYAWFFLPPYLRQTRVSIVSPIPTPVLVGCAMAVKKTYFNSIGRFDPGLQIWGGEHFDLSFRVWTSGGTVETVPCSKVGHVFKRNNYDYGVNDRGYVITKNLLRVAEIWMDEYATFVYASARALFSPLPTFTEQDWASIEKRRRLRTRLKCKDFTWYLTHILPEQRIPSNIAVWFGEVTNEQTEGCLYAMTDGFIGVTHRCFKHRVLPENTFTIDTLGRLTHEGSCAVFNARSRLLKLGVCPCLLEHELSRLTWEVTHRKQLILTGIWGTLCASHVTVVTSEHKDGQVVQMLPCDANNAFQRWNFMYHFIH